MICSLQLILNLSGNGNIYGAGKRILAINTDACPIEWGLRLIMWLIWQQGLCAANDNGWRLTNAPSSAISPISLYIYILHPKRWIVRNKLFCRSNFFSYCKLRQC